jgi:ribosomal protein L7Ae-like RNA K-turn-binding protein
MGKPPEPKKSKKRKRKLPTSFLDCASLVQVVDFPSATGKKGKLITTEVASDVVKEIFLERLVKEIVKPYRPSRVNDGGESFVMVDGTLQKRKIQKEKKNDDKSTKNDEASIWKQRVKIGTNQCLQVLDSSLPDNKTSAPSLLVLARDIYPPTMLAHVPAVAQKLGIPLLMLPGKASLELGQAIGIKKTSIILFLRSTATDSKNMALNSFVAFVISQIPK